MIALYKCNHIIELDKLIEGAGYNTAHFYSVKSLLDQIMNPMVIVTPCVYKKEVENLPVPIVPITIQLADILKSIELNYSEQEEKVHYCLIATEEEICWLKKECSADARISLQFISVDEFLSAGLQEDFIYFTPAWNKNLFPDHLFSSIHAITPSISSLLYALQFVCSLEQFTGEIARERYQVEAIVDSSHDGVIAVDREGNITVANQHAKTILGLQGEVKGRKITDFIPDSDMMRVLHTGKVEIGDIATVMDRQIMINRFPVIVMGVVVGAVSNFKEITDIQKLEMKLRRLLHKSGLEAKYRIRDIIGKSAVITKAREMASKFAKTGATVLITGESGTGKELFAQGIHLASDRSLGPFVAVNCAALPESLLESELFGYEEGAFTGARKGGKSGLFELAHGGTLFLDEIGEMPLRIQALLLRVLQERTVRRVGGERITPVDVRIIAATNRHLEEEIESKQFRTDLYYRLNVLTLEIPPLRERLTDIPELVESIVHQLNEQRDPKIHYIDPEIHQLFMRYDWPGNIRELRNILERMVVLEQGTTLSLQGAEFFHQKVSRNIPKMVEASSSHSVKENEKELILTALAKHGYNKTMAAKALGVDRSTLWRKMRQYNL